jgi:hypothetical protein
MGGKRTLVVQPRPLKPGVKPKAIRRSKMHHIHEHFLNGCSF